MSTFFVFSDEAGEYRRDRTDKFIQINPDYCKASIIADAADWKWLRDELCDLKESMLKIAPDKEVKWSYLWSLYKSRKNKTPISQDKPYYFLRNHPDALLKKYVETAIKLLCRCEFIKLIYTVTINNRDKTGNISQVEIFRMHMQDIMHRVQMEIQSEEENLCVIYFDSKGREIDEKLKEAYHTIYQQGDFIHKYTHIQ